ncbi:MAG: ABC transporter permease [Ignavibacteriales bacterium]|nr:MAG: ABC transporter permease [Ignavibacteriales bacterium]
MFKNYLIIALRNIKKNKLYSFINIFGLAIGIACCLLIVLYISDELSFDTFHKNADRIYRVNTDLKFGGTELHIPVTSDLMGPLLKQDYPEVEEYTRIFSFVGKKLLKKENEYVVARSFAFVDSTFFKVFTFPAISGNINNALTEPNTVVVTESFAKNYFGTVNAIGSFIETDDNGSTFLKVTAVIKDMPSNSHFNFDFLLSMKDLQYDWGNLVSSNFHTYLLLKEGTDYRAFDKKLVEFNNKYTFPYAKKFLQVNSREEFEKAGNRIDNSLIPITKIHLYSKRVQELSPTGSIQYVYIYAAIAIFILLIACVNFMNLTTARSANRAREVGIRKVLGTERKNLISQFLSESTLMACLAVLIALVLVFLTLPAFGKLSGKQLYYSKIFSLQIFPFIILMPLIIGFIAGSYPAFYLSKFNPAFIIKGSSLTGKKGEGLRSALVVFQFATSITLIISTIIIYKQLNYIQSTNLGYQRDQILIVNDTYALHNIETFKNELLKVPGVAAGTISEFLPVPSARNFTAFYKDAASVSKSGLTMQRWKIDYDYLETFGMKIVEGRNFSPDFGSDSSSIILNETAVKRMKYSSPLNAEMYTWEEGGKIAKYKIIGVVKDFHFESFHQDIGALCLTLGKSYGNVSFKLSAAAIPEFLSKAKSLWKDLAQTMPFSYRFMDESFNEVYRAEQNTGVTVLIFSVLSIFVACLGLFGLAAFLAEKKTKEIGVRKVLGASVPSLLYMLSKEFMKWIILANLIAWPAAFYFMREWLSDFAYRINFPYWIFLVSALIAILIGLITVGSQVIKSALANPAKSLKYE